VAPGWPPDLPEALGAFSVVPGFLPQEITKAIANRALAFDRRTAPGYSVVVQSEPPASSPGPTPSADRDRRRLERILPLIIKRALETGLGKLAEAPENARNLVGDLRLPKEILSLILSQFDDAKNGLYRVVAKETRDFLEHTNFAEEFAKVLTTLSFEIKTEVRFIPNDSRLGATPDLRSRVRVKKNDKADSERSPTVPPPPDPPDPHGEGQT
jgi:hypothetical protein